MDTQTPVQASLPRVKQYKAWSEQTSSSGKRYYYNRETEVSQWDKPQEWRDYEKSMVQQATTPKETSRQAQQLLPPLGQASISKQRLEQTPSSAGQQQQKGLKRPSDSLMDDSRCSTTKLRRESTQTPSPLPTQAMETRRTSPAPPSASTSFGRSTNYFTATSSTSSQAGKTPHSSNTTKTAAVTRQSYADNQSQSNTSTSVPSATPNRQQPTFREEKYLKYYRAELANFKRNWSADHYTAEAKKLAERRKMQDATISSIDEDIMSVQSLLKTAETRSTLLAKRLELIGQRISGLEGRNQ